MNFYLLVMEAFYFLSDAQKAAQLSSNLKTVMIQRRKTNFSEQPFDTCYLQTAYEANDLRRRPLLRLAEIIKHDTVKLPRATEAELKQIGVLMSGITANVSEWIKNELENAWPEDIIGKAKSSIGLSDITDPDAYNSTARKIEARVSSMGVPGLIYQVLVSLDWDYLRNFYYGCRMPNYCTVVKGYHKINFAIFRHGEKNIYRNERSKEWYAKVNDSISAVIASNAKIDDLGSLVKEIEAACCSLLSDHLYNGFVLLHQSCFLAKYCDLSTGAAFSKDFGVDATACLFCSCSVPTSRTEQEQEQNRNRTE
uniref:Uncharacterized protein n=1 Tax=Globodera rostochiensis TaxID=31243 RepID=A0A914I6Z1_GLORO